MSDPVGEFTHRSALAGPVGGGARITALPEGGVLHLLGRAGSPAPELDGLRAAGPGQWFLVSDAPFDAAALAARFPDLAISDQGHGRVRIAVEGPRAADMLAKGTAIDLERMPLGASAQTLVGPIGAHLTRTGEQSFELMVLRGFAASLWHDLEAMAAEW